MSRRPLTPPERDRQAPDEHEEGQYIGIEYANVQPMIANLVALPEGGVNTVALHSYKHGPADLDDLLDAFEIDAVSRSWRRARVANQKAERDA